MHLAQLNTARLKTAPLNIARLIALDGPRLALLRGDGPGPDALTLREPHPAPAGEIGTFAT